MILYILYKTDYGGSTVLNVRLLRIEEQEETLRATPWKRMWPTEHVSLRMRM